MSLSAVRQFEGRRVGGGPSILECFHFLKGLGKSQALVRAESSITSTQSISAAFHIDSTTSWSPNTFHHVDGDDRVPSISTSQFARG